MTLLGLILLLVLLGAAIAIVRLIPSTIVDGTMRQIIIIVLVVAAILFLVNGFLGEGHSLNPRLW